MAACRYGISLLTFELLSLVRYQVEHLKRNSISTLTHELSQVSNVFSTATLIGDTVNKKYYK